MAKDMTEGLLLKALQDAVSEQSVDGLRTRDIKDLIGWSLPKIRYFLERLVNAGRVRPIHTVETSFTGRRCAFVRYQLVESGEEGSNSQKEQK